MITKADCLSILVKLGDTGVDVNSQIKKLAISKELPMDVLQFIAKNQGIEATKFYERLRKNYNAKKSPLYLNILKETTNIDDIITTLSCLLTQIILYNNKLDKKEREIFLKEVRTEEISRVLNEYFKTNNSENCIAVLRLVKTDLMVLEALIGRREFE